MMVKVRTTPKNRKNRNQSNLSINICARSPGDRASASGAEDRWFESSRAYQLNQVVIEESNIFFFFFLKLIGCGSFRTTQVYSS